jgi:hypothetical protein
MCFIKYLVTGAHFEVMNTYNHKLTESALGAAHLQHELVRFTVGYE